MIHQNIMCGTNIFTYIYIIFFTWKKVWTLLPCQHPKILLAYPNFQMPDNHSYKIDTISSPARFQNELKNYLISLTIASFRTLNIFSIISKITKEYFLNDIIIPQFQCQQHTMCIVQLQFIIKLCIDKNNFHGKNFNS